MIVQWLPFRFRSFVQPISQVRPPFGISTLGIKPNCGCLDVRGESSNVSVTRIGAGDYEEETLKE